MAICRISNRITGLGWDVHTVCRQLEKHDLDLLRAQLHPLMGSRIILG